MRGRTFEAAAKLDLRLNLQTFLPSCAIIEETSHHADTRAPALCAHLRDGEIALFDKAYIHFHHQQHRMGGLERRRNLPGAVGHRGLLQAAQANSPGLRLPRPQQRGVPLAALGHAAALRADALAGSGGGLDAQFLAAAGDDLWIALEADGKTPIRREIRVSDIGKVFADAHCTETYGSTAALAPLRQSAILNRINKRDHYLEAMTKAFLLDHPKIFLGAPKLLETKLWHHGPTVISLFRALTELKTLKTQKDRARSLADKATLNSAIKTAIDRLKQDFPTTAKME